MEKRISSMGSRSQLAQYLRQPAFTGTVQEIAGAHEFNRQNVVKQILLHVFLMSKFRMITGAMAVRKAENQYLSAQGDNEAAHCAPGQITANGGPIQKLITADDELEMTLENLFATTDVMNFKFNWSDSRAESSGLRAALLAACTDAASSGRYARFNVAEQFLPHINTAFAVYRAAAITAYGSAIADQRTKMAANKTIKRTTRPELIAVLEIYRHEIVTAIPTLDSVQGLYLKDVWDAYAGVAKSQGLR